MIGACLAKLDFNQYEIIIVDNNSSDDSCVLIEKRFPQIKLIKLAQNIGFSRANNIALRQVKTEFALILNPDAFIDFESIEKILDKMKTDSRIALAGPIIYHANLEAGEMKNIQLVNKCLDNVYKKDGDVYLVKFLTGAAMFIRMEIINKIGFFDENFFLYCEDNEICKRAFKKGYKNIIVEGTKLLHLSGQSTGRKNEKEVRQIYWHRFGWSKAYYTQTVHGIVVAKLKAMRMILKTLILMVKGFLLGKKISMINRATFLGAGAYLIGYGAFQKDGNARG